MHTLQHLRAVKARFFLTRDGRYAENAGAIFGVMPKEAQAQGETVATPLDLRRGKEKSC